jgi:hypothetical protein
MTSPRWSISKEQRDSILRSLYKYTAPLLLLFLIEVQKGTPTDQAMILVYGAALQVAINFISKFVTETK